jgi:SSS family transporter
VTDSATTAAAAATTTLTTVGGLQTLDYVVIAFYLCFMLGMTVAFKGFVKNTSDYFRGGGEMLWWIVGAGAFMTSFSAVTFTGMAGKAYLDGPVVLVIFVGNAFGFFFNWLYFAPVFRQMRCVTAMEAVRKRFGAANEQFFTWLQIPTGILYAAIWLNGLAVFTAAAFGWSLEWTIVVTGAVVVFMSVVGGSWSTTASDFVQLLLLMPITVVAAVFALIHVGGVDAFVQRVPEHFWRWDQVANPNLIVLWVIAMLMQKFVSINNLTDASRYLSVKDTAHARRAALLGTVCFIVGPAVWFIPPMAARIAFPDLKPMFPALKNPQDASYFAIAMATMPAGMVGLLLTGIASATMSSMDSGLNKNAGYFIKNFYQPKLRRGAGEQELMIASVVTTLVMGALVIVAANWFASLSNLPIFNLMVNFGGWVALPISVPLIWGMFVRKAPSWAGWSSVVVGLAASYLTNRFLTAEVGAGLLGLDALNKREASDWAQLAGILVNIAAGSAWFLGSAAFHRSRPATEVKRVDHFFTEMHTPVDFAREEGAAGGGSDNLQARVMGNLCLIYGGFITLLAALPNPWLGRLAFLFCGGAMFGVGWALRRASHGTRVAAPAVAGIGTTKAAPGEIGPTR